MNDFGLFFELGFEHIADINGIDHILFILILCLGYNLQSWKKLLVLITAFTVGHSITLGLSTFEIVHFSTTWIEFLIPLTIIVTAIYQVSTVEKLNQLKRLSVIYWLALIFGLIHGLGFSNYLKSLLGKEMNITTQLLAFNLGLETGQILIVAILLLLSFLFIHVFKTKKLIFDTFICGGVFFIALQMMISRWPF